MSPCKSEVEKMRSFFVTHNWRLATANGVEGRDWWAPRPWKFPCLCVGLPTWTTQDFRVGIWDNTGLEFAVQVETFEEVRAHLVMLMLTKGLKFKG